jgi:predicted transcriptional regulator of viral defense system
MADYPNVLGAMALETRGNAVDHLIGTLAERQHGVVARRDLMRAGVTCDAIRHRVAHGRLHTLHRGVYAVGHTVLSADGIRMAAVLAAGPGAVLSHRSAASLWGLRPWNAIEITVEQPRRPRSGMRIHELPLSRDAVTIERSIPVTTVPRTLFDLAAVLPRAQLERAINEAEVQRLTDPLSLADFVERYPRRSGVAVIKAILATTDAGANLTRSELEDRFLSFLEQAGLPQPEVNAHLFVAGRWIECDCVWRNARVIVELDGLAAHGTAAAFERDRARDRMLSARGWRLVRITWRQLHEEAAAVAYDLSALLTSAAVMAPSRRTAHSLSAS